MQHHGRISNSKHTAPVSNSTRTQLSNFAPSAEKMSAGISCGSIYLKSAEPVSSTMRPASPKLIVRSSSENSCTRPPLKNTMTTALLTDVTEIGVCSAFHLLNNSKASLDDILFIAVSQQFGANAAIFLADKFHLKCQRPLRALRAMMSGHGKSYTKQSAKTRQPSDSPASSKNRP